MDNNTQPQLWESTACWHFHCITHVVEKSGGYFLLWHLIKNVTYFVKRKSHVFVIFAIYGVFCILHFVCVCFYFFIFGIPCRRNAESKTLKTRAHMHERNWNHMRVCVYVCMYMYAFKCLLTYVCISHAFSQKSHSPTFSTRNQATTRTTC